MKKKLLAVLLAFSLVLAFSGMALAADSFSVQADAGADKTAAVVDEGENKFSVYTNGESVQLSFTLKEGYDLRIGGATAAAPLENGAVVHTLTGETSYNVGPAGSDEQRESYTFTLKKVSVTIEDNLYQTADTADKYAVSGGRLLVPALAAPYAKISVSGAEGAFTVSGAASPDANGFVRLSSFNDSTLKKTVAVSIGGKEFAKKEFTLLRPTLDTINFNSRASNSGDETLTISSGAYEYDTKDQVKADWSTVHFQVNPLCSEAAVEVKQGSSKMTPASSGWYSQRMNKGSYKLTVSVSVGAGDDAVTQDYTVYLMSGSYAGPAVKTLTAAEKTGGSGEKYLTVIDEKDKQLHIFLPKDTASFYLSLAMDASVKDLRLDGAAIEEGAWYSRTAGLDGKKLTYSDEAGVAYAYTVQVYDDANDHAKDASLRSLLVRSGSRQSTADNVALGFAADTLEYAFPVDKGDVYLYISAAANHSQATVFINDQLASTLTVTDLDTDAVSEFKILVVAGDHKTTKTYTLTVNGASGLLQTLSVSNLKGLTPAFKPDTASYTGYTAANTVSTNIVALAKNYSSDFVRISKANYNQYGQVASYSALTNATQGGVNVTAALSTGSNIFRVDVLASANAATPKGSYYISVYVPAASPKCVVSSQQLYVNGKAATLSAYNIAGNNYLKLRDIAALLDGTVKEMNVDWDGANWTATMAMPGTFVKRGDELTTLTPPKKYELSTQYFTYNTLPVYPLAYNVTGSGDATGSNYVMLRDLASLLDFGVTYNAGSQAIYIDTASSYTPGL